VQEHEALIDEVSQLPNREAFEKHRAKLPEADKGVAFFGMDIQGFKAVNDQISHAAGDKALREWGDLVKKCVEGEKQPVRYSLFGKPRRVAHGTVYRTGGDELCVIWAKPHSASMAAFRERVEHCAKDLSEISHHAKGEKEGDQLVQVPTFLRVGVGPTPEDADKLEIEIRREVYMAAFGSLEARGKWVERWSPELEGIQTWKATWPALNSQVRYVKLSADHSACHDELFEI
jgi:GGDEF domain-containing protein